MQIITNADKVNRKQWADFVVNHPQGSIFQTPEMYDACKNTKHYEPLIVSVINDDNQIAAIFLAVIQKEYSGIIGSFTARSVIFGDFLIKNNNPLLLDLLLKEYKKLIKNRAVYTQIRNFNVQNSILQEVFLNNGYKFENHLNILLDLTIGVDALWKGVKKNRKDGINKARKQKFVFKVADKLNNPYEFYSLLKELYKSNRVPYPDISLFQNFNDIFNKENLKWFILEYNNKPHIILCAFRFNKTLYIFYIGINQNDEFLLLRPFDYFCWEVIKWGCENGINIFDWMGAGKPDQDYGVRKFKLQYGGELINFGRYEKIHKPLIYYFAKTGLKLWQKLKK